MTLQHERDVFFAAADGFVDLVSRIGSHRWDSPGLGAWDLRALVGHASRSLITITEYVDRPVETEEIASPGAYYEAAAAMAGADLAAVVERGRQAGLVLGEDPAAAVRALRDRAVARLSDQPDVLMHTIVGGMSLEHYLPTRTFELVVHGLDIARAAELPYTPRPDVLARSLALAGEIAVRTGAGAQVLLALTGRARLDEDFSVV